MNTELIMNTFMNLSTRFPRFWSNTKRWRHTKRNQTGVLNALKSHEHSQKAAKLSEYFLTGTTKLTFPRVANSQGFRLRSCEEVVGWAFQLMNSMGPLQLRGHAVKLESKWRTGTCTGTCPTASFALDFFCATWSLSCKRPITHEASRVNAIISRNLN